MQNDPTPATCHPVFSYQGAATGRHYHFPKRLESDGGALHGVTDIGLSLIAHTTGDTKLLAEIARRYNAYDGLIDALEAADKAFSPACGDWHESQAALMKARAALALAKGAES